MTQADGDDRAERSRALEEALDEALASVQDGGGDSAPDSEDYRWLGIGMRLGLERPGHARHLLELVGARNADAAAADLAAGADPAAADPGSTGPVLSLLLARSAALPRSEMTAVGPGVVFGWADELTSAQVRAIGGVVTAMLAEGVTADVGRGFGLAWDGGARIPGPERDALFDDFTQLQVAVAGVLVGRDLRSVEVAPRPHGFGAFAQLFGTRAASGPSPAAAAIDAAGEPGRRGLVALWNTWVVMRFRPSIPGPTFELLTRPWVTVVGRLPDR